MKLKDAEELWFEEVRLDCSPSSTTAFDQDNANEGLFYMPAGKIGNRYASVSVCLLLLRVVDADQGIFERLGYGLQEFEEASVTYDAILADVDEDVKKGLPCVRYEDGMHTIRII